MTPADVLAAVPRHLIRAGDLEAVRRLTAEAVALVRAAEPPEE